MSLTLKLDGRNGRGRCWRELSACGKPINQGALLSGKVCSHCNQQPDTEKHVIKCMKCNVPFHISCLLKPLTEDHVCLISDNPSMWWFCLNCMSTKSTEAACLTTASDLSASPPSDALLSSTLMTFKKDMLTLISETIDKKLENKCTVPLNANTVQESCPSNVWGVNTTQPFTPSNETRTTPHPKANGVHKERKKLSNPSKKHVLLLDPNNTELVSSDNYKKITLQDVNKAITGVNVNFCKVKKSGIVALGFEDESSKQNAEKRINQCSKMSKSFSTRSPEKQLPKVTVFNINDVLFDDCDKSDREEMKSVLLKDILARNGDIKQLMDSNDNEVLEVVMLQKSMPYDNIVTYSAALKMSCNIRKVIHNKNNKLYVSLSRCNVVDRYHVLQCYHCQKYGHHSDKCPTKDDKPTCMYCAGPHMSKNCLDKKQTCCSNCLNSSNSAFKAKAHSHTAGSKMCPFMRSIQENIKGNTANWLGKN